MEYERPSPKRVDAISSDDPVDRDPLFDQAVEIVIETGRGSVGLLQRRLAIGYSRANRLIDQMALAGILSDHKGSQARDVLITMDEWEQMKRLGAGLDGSDDAEDLDDDFDDDGGPVETPDAPQH
jgi:S-DNA-T family DNA segregation ATPase FtsK/SpoIIIE